MIDVVLPCYNQAEFLPKMLDSIKKQTDKDFNLVMLDDGSTDVTRVIIQDFDICCIRIFRTENIGLPKTLDQGFSYCKSDWCTWISADCWLEPNFVEVLNKSFDEKTDFIQTDWYIEPGTRRVNYSHLAPKCQMQNHGASFAFRRKIYDSVSYGQFKEGYEDGMFYAMCRVLNLPFKYVPEALYHFTIHPNTISARLHNGLHRYREGIKQLKRRYPTASCWKTFGKGI